MQSSTAACKKMIPPPSSVSMLPYTRSLCSSYTCWLTGMRSYDLKSCATMSLCLSLVCSVQTAIRQEPRPSTSIPLHHIHRPFPACRVIPAPALPPLPSRTYQPPAAVPLPESGSRTLDTVDKQQHLIHLPLCPSLSLYKSVYFNFSSHIVSPGNKLLNLLPPGSLGLVSMHVCTKSLLLHFSASHQSQGVV